MVSLNFLIKKTFVILFLLLLFSCIRKSETIYHLTSNDTAYMENRLIFNLRETSKETDSIFYNTIFLSKSKSKLILTRTSLFFFFLEGEMLVYAKRLSANKIVRNFFVFNNDGFYAKTNYDYVKQLCQTSPNCLHSFDSLPFIRREDSLFFYPVAKTESKSIKNFNRLIDFIQNSEQLQINDFYYLVFLTQIVPVYYSAAPLLSKNETKLWQSKEFFSIYTSLDNIKKSYLFEVLKADEKSKIKWLKENSIFLQRYIDEEQKQQDTAVFYIVTYPDLKFFKFKRTENNHLTYKEFVNLQYIWLDPFYFYYPFCCDEYIYSDETQRFYVEF